ncbi:MAG: hypothetical protein K8R69_05610 [Deltaproteobacteria bacterium]|nr:hypothetical protein [Deltaproteobacteria bacterium]
MKKILSILSFAALGAIALPLQAATPVFSANGFVCGKEGVTVTCKGSLPNGKDTVTSTGHDLVYLTMNTHQEGVPTRYTYFSDTGCLIGYTFGAGGQPVAAVASHRNGVKQTFSFEDGKYEKIIQFCMQDAPTATAGKTPPAAVPAASAASEKPVTTAQKDSAPAKKSATAAAPKKPAAAK